MKRLGELLEGEAPTVEETEPPKRHPFPGMAGYNPRVDAPVIVSLGGKFIEEGAWRGKYRVNGHVCDAWGRLLDEDACPMCQGAGKMLMDPNPNPWAKPWEQAFVTCPRCVPANTPI